MKQAQCPVCNKWIEGFTKKDLDYKMIMHSLKHRDKSNENHDIDEKEVIKDD